MKECWKYIEGYDKKYMISNKGRIKSFKKNEQKILAICNRGNGYLMIGLYKKKVRKSLSIHRLIAQAFIPNFKKKPCVNHIDGNKLNNNISNLEWCTYSENILHAQKTGLKRILKGNEQNSAKLTEKEVMRIRKTYSYGHIYQRELATLFNVKSSTISAIITRRNWKHIEGEQ